MWRRSTLNGRRHRVAALAAVALHAAVFFVARDGEVSRRPADIPALTSWTQQSPPRQPIIVEVRSVTPPTLPEPVFARSTPTTPTRTTTTTTTTPTTTTPTTTTTTTTTTPTPTTTAFEGGVDLAPRPENLPHRVMQLVQGPGSKGPRQSTRSLAGALDFTPEQDEDFGKSGAVLAAARAERHLRHSLAFHDVTVGMASDWFREVKQAAERGFRPGAADLDNPGEVSRSAIMANFLQDPSSWDDEAKRVLGPLLQATSLHSQDPIKRLTLGASANLGSHNDTQLRMSTIEDLLQRKEAGLSVRFAFEVDVHHDGEGKVTAVDVLRSQFEKQLQEKIRLAIDDAVRAATTAPALIAGGRPFRSRWLFAATWFIDPPGCLAMPSDAMGATPGVPQMSCGGTFDVTSEGVTTSSFDVRQRVTAELLRVTPVSERR